MSTLQASRGAIADARAWDASTIDDRAAWYLPLPSEILTALDAAVASFRRDPLPLTHIRLGAGTLAAWSTALAPAIAGLETGRGFVIVEGLPLERWSDAEAQLAYWLVGQTLGAPFEQNVQGTLLYDVWDTGQTVTQGARFSVTNADSSFHTDNSFDDSVLDYVGLLCLRTARSGGVNQVVSGFAAAAALVGEHPDAAAVLARPFHVDRRGGVKPREAPTARIPVLRWDGGELLVRYLRFWIHAGHDKAGIPLSAEQWEALDVFDAILLRPALRVEFFLAPGQMFFINNRWILHNRTAFEDHSEPENQRHLVRLWLRSWDGHGMHGHGHGMHGHGLHGRGLQGAMG